eukprot:s3830_g4.t1
MHESEKRHVSVTHPEILLRVARDSVHLRIRLPDFVAKLLEWLQRGRCLYLDKPTKKGLINDGNELEENLEGCQAAMLSRVNVQLSSLEDRLSCLEREVSSLRARQGFCEEMRSFLNDRGRMPRRQRLTGKRDSDDKKREDALARRWARVAEEDLPQDLRREFADLFQDEESQVRLLGQDLRDEFAVAWSELLVIGNSATQVERCRVQCAIVAKSLGEASDRKGKND